MNWQLQEAKQKFSELVRRALTSGPQVVTRHGRAAVVVVSAEDYGRLRGGAGFKEFLRTAPDLSRLGIRRDRRPGRRVTL
jgi:prevent-host-death family protein